MRRIVADDAAEGGALGPRAYAGAMRILLVSQYFTPERTAAPLRLHPFAAGLAERGHSVEVIAEVPSHPEGVVHPGYGGKLIDKRRLDGIDVRYVWTYATPSKAVPKRLIGYASFVASALLAGLGGPRPDVILASSPPLTVGAVGTMLATRHRVPWVLDCRDLWPSAAESLEVVESGLLLGMARWLERRVYASADVITTTTEPFRTHIEATGGAGKTRLIPNGTTENWLDMAEVEVDRGGLGLPTDTFLWTYAGNLGLSYDLEPAVHAAAELGDGYTLLIVGTGPHRPALEEAAARLAPGRVIFRDAVAPEVAAQVMRASDALLVAVPAAEGTIAVKLYDSCAVARPVIVAGEGETASVASEAGAALIVPGESPQALAGAVRSLATEQAVGERLVRAGTAFAEANRRDRQLEPLEQALRAAVDGG
jgi:colanic acid biosynthesis glycosyl transferase WcaI